MVKVYPSICLWCGAGEVMRGAEMLRGRWYHGAGGGTGPSTGPVMGWPGHRDHGHTGHWSPPGPGSVVTRTEARTNLHQHTTTLQHFIRSVEATINNVPQIVNHQFLKLALCRLNLSVSALCWMRVGCVVEVPAREDDDRGHVPTPGLLQPRPRPRARPAAAASAWTLQGKQRVKLSQIHSRYLY